MRWPLLAGDQCQDGANGSRLHDGCERFTEVDPGTLSVNAQYPAGFIAFQVYLSIFGPARPGPHQARPRILLDGRGQRS
jgi:hypothetical protein